MPFAHPAAVELRWSDVSVGPKFQAFLFHCTPNTVDRITLDLALSDDRLKADGVIVVECGGLGLLRGGTVPHHFHITVAYRVVVVDLKGMRSACGRNILAYLAHEQGRGVRAEQHIIIAYLCKAAEHFLLALEYFRDIFDNHVRILASLLQRGNVGNACSGLVGFRLHQATGLNVEFQKAFNTFGTAFAG